MANFYGLIKEMFHIHKVYSIETKGLEFCPMEKTYRENLSEFDATLNDVLRYLSTGPKVDEQIFVQFSHQYPNIEDVLVSAKYMGLISAKRSILH